MTSRTYGSVLSLCSLVNAKDALPIASIFVALSLERLSSVAHRNLTMSKKSTASTVTSSNDYDAIRIAYATHLIEPIEPPANSRPARKALPGAAQMSLERYGRGGIHD